MEAVGDRGGAVGPVDGERSSVAALGVSGAPGGADPVPAGGRQRRVVGGRSRRVEVRVTDAEYEVLAARAGVVGVSVPRFLVECGLDTGGLSPGEKRAKFATFMAVRRTLAGAATNLNQLAKWANTEHQWPSEAGPAADAVEAAAAQVEAAIEGLER